VDPRGPKDTGKPPEQKNLTRADLLRLRTVANGSHTLGAQRFQGLFHSLSKVQPGESGPEFQQPPFPATA